MASSNSKSITITPSAYSLLILHASKHPSCSILGLLVGKANSSSLQIQSVVPLLHHHTSLGTMSQVASSLVQAHLNNQTGEKLQILGAYQANANKDDREPNGATKALVGRIAQMSSLQNGVLLVLQTHLLLSPTSLALAPHLVSPASSTPASSNSLSTQSSEVSTLPTLPFPPSTSLPTSSLTLDSSKEIETFVKSLGQEVKAGKGLKVVDFDEHLEDTTLDWLNNKEVLSSISV